MCLPLVVCYCHQSPLLHQCNLHLSIFAIHKATYMRNENSIADLSQIFYSTKEFIDETMFTKLSDHNFLDFLLLVRTTM
jgi:hypothetical protein